MRSCNIVPGRFFGADLEPGTFHGAKVERGTFHHRELSILRLGDRPVGGYTPGPREVVEANVEPKPTAAPTDAGAPDASAAGSSRRGEAFPLQRGSSGQ